MSLGSGMVTELLFLPDGCTTDDADWNLFSLWVVWRGNGRYAVQRRSTDRYADQLSRAGNWAFAPEKFRRRQYRHSFEEAVGWAESLRNTATFQGMSWAELKDRRARR